MFEEMNITEKLHAIDQLCRRNGGIPGVPLWIPAGAKIVRSVRGHGKNTLSELTYKPAECCKNYMRATLPNETAFYGCIGDDPHPTDAYSKARVMSLAECSSSFRIAMKPTEDEKYTTSVWRANRQIQAICFITADTFPSTHGETIDKIREVYEKNVNDHKYSQKQIELLAEINKEFTKIVESGHELEYMITANLCHSCLYAPDTDGIQNEAVVYASVQTSGELGLNVAIRPDVADEFLILDHVIEQTYDTQCNLRFVPKELSSIDMYS